MAKDGSSRRSFLQGGLAAGTGAGALVALGAPALAHAETSVGRTTFSHFHVPASDKTVHWGYFSKSLKPVVEVVSGDFVTIETVTHHANDDAERMVKGDPGVESIFHWESQAQRGRPAWRWTDGCVAVRARRGRGAGCPHLHGAGGGEGGGAGRHPRGADPRRAPAAVRESQVRGQDLRQQRRRLVGLPLQGPARGARSRAR